MKKSVGISVVIGVEIIIGIIVFQLNDTMWEKTSTEEYYEKRGQVSGVVYPDNPQFLYGLKINKDKYLLGENIFVSVSQIPLGFSDKILFFTPEGKLYHQTVFDGNKSDYAKEYFRPMLLRSLDICEKEQLIGEWTVYFSTNRNERLTFEIVDEMLPNNERYYDGCNITQQNFEIDPTRNIPP